MRRTLITLTALLLSTCAARAVSAHEVRGQLSRAGMGFLEAQLPSYVPPHLAPPAMTMELFTCPGGRVVTLTQSDTEIDLIVHDVQLTVPEPGVLRAELRFDVFAAGSAYVQYPYACFGYADCRDELALVGARATADFRAGMGADGRASVELIDVQLYADADDVQFALSDCAIDDVVNFVIDVAKDWLLGMLTDKLEDVARDQLAPVIRDLLGGFVQYDGTLGFVDFTVALTNLDVDQDGVLLLADGDLSTTVQPHSCIGDDPGEPASQAGAPPSLTGITSDLGLAIDLGLVDDVLYHVWRDGLLCLTEAHLAAFGVDFDPALVAELLPGFPAGTDVGIELSLASPPRVHGMAGPGAALTLDLDGLAISVAGRLPDGTIKYMNVVANATASARVEVDPAINALVLRITGATLTQMQMDQEGAINDGFDIARFQRVVEELVLPAALGELGALPLTGPVVSLADYYVILRDVRTTDGYLVAEADLFRAPADDTTAPDSYFDAVPRGTVAVADAVVVVGGIDSQVPSELLSFRVSVDGVERPASYIKAYAIGQEGVTASYDVAVRAVDLAGNVDSTPARATVTVDGIHPTLRVTSPAINQLTRDDAVARLAWEATDDLTEPDAIAARVALYRLPDDNEVLAAELLGSAELAPGTRSAELALEPGALYRIAITAIDEAGNESTRYVLYSVEADPAVGCGCRTTSTSPSWLAFLALLLLLRRPSPRRGEEKGGGRKHS